MENYEWPGNIRQVENFVERLTVTHKRDLLEAEDLPDKIRGEQGKEPEFESQTLSEMMDAYEEDIMKRALKQYKTSIAVARALGIGQTTAARKLRKYIPGYAEKERR